MLDHTYAVIMAGGGGTRLWPISRQARPKQMLRITNNRTLFQLAVDRLNGLLPLERILVVTTASQAPELQNECPSIPPHNFLLEPMPRGTASVVGFSAMALSHRDPEATMVILTADHFIQNVPFFQKLITAGSEIAQQGYLVTLGIRPSFPSTGYGYIQRGKMLGEVTDLPYFQVARFKEKPDEATAQNLLERGDHDWNSGMFIWRVDRILEEFQSWMPEFYNDLNQISQAWDSPIRQSVIQSVWPTIQTQTIDYGIMERSQQVVVLPAEDLGWNDVGSWESLFEVLPSDEHGNILIHARHIGMDTQSSLVYAEEPERLIVTIGLNNTIVVDTGDVVLVCSRDSAQKVRELVNYLKQNGYQNYL